MAFWVKIIALEKEGKLIYLCPKNHELAIRSSETCPELCPTCEKEKD